MALRKCDECNHDVSSKAASCPHCGAPIATAAEATAAGVQLTTVQETGKRLKAQIVIASVLFWVGAIWMTVGFGAASPPGVLATLLIVVGFAWYVVTRARIWWHHK
jgi:uncharacterized OB-fold protein